MFPALVAVLESLCLFDCSVYVHGAEPFDVRAPPPHWKAVLESIVSMIVLVLCETSSFGLLGMIWIHRVVSSHEPL